VAVFFLDSSAVVKRYVRESGSGWVHSLFDPSENNDIWIARVTPVEMIAAMARRARVERMPISVVESAYTLFRQDLRRDFQILGVDQPLVEQAMGLAERHALRGYDAMQLASACQVQSMTLAANLAPITLISADTELNQAALAAGLLVEDPSKHT
jgi:predicted nucleic acid-binding protein